MCARERGQNRVKKRAKKPKGIERESKNPTITRKLFLKPICIFYERRCHTKVKNSIFDVYKNNK